MSTTLAGDVLTEDMLARFDERAPRYDRENAFFSEDLEELRASGYLLLPVPTELGGLGLDLAQVLAYQRRLAYVAPATAVAVNMHFYWVGLAADLRRSGDHSCDWMLEEAAAGKIFAAGHGEAGNDLPLLLSTTRADRVDGGWEITGHKIFGTLSPVWDFLGIHAMTADPDHPQVVHAFVPRDATGYHIAETWDAMGMRATMSHDTIFERCFVSDARTALVCPAGFAGAGPFQVGIFAWALLGFGTVYTAIARRALDLTVAKMHQRTSLALTRSMAYHPEVQHRIAEMRAGVDVAEAMVERAAADWSAGVAHEDWPVRLVVAKHEAVERAFRVVDDALDLTGGSGIFKSSRIEQLFREARLGRVHPANDLLFHELVGKLCLGIDPDEAPRWG